jgi:hypothetical protein
MDPLWRSLADLPEELIELTLRSITCQSSLAAAALTSRQLHRIAQPILIESVSIFVSPNRKILKQYDNRRRFQQALMEQPDLASSVKTLKLFRFDAKVSYRQETPENNGRFFMGELNSLIPVLLSSLPHLEVLDASEYLQHRLSHSPIMWAIDLWLKTSYENYTPIFTEYLSLAPPPVRFTRLKVLDVSMVYYCSNSYFVPLFRLPNLEHLGLHHLTIRDDDWVVDRCWRAIEDCPIKSLSLTNLHIISWTNLHIIPRPNDDRNLLHTMATILKHLQTLDITAVDRGHATLALNAFKQRIPQLQTLEAYRNIDHPPEQRGIVLEDQDEQDLDDKDADDADADDEGTDDEDLDNQDLINRLADEWRNDWLFPALASAPALKVLRLDVTDLHIPVSLKEVPGPLDWNTSMPNLAAYYRNEVYAYASEGAFEDCWNRMQIPLSPAVEEVYLHLRATDMRRYGIGLLHALTQLGLDLPASAPKLRRVGMVVRENNEERDTGAVWREMAGLFRGKGAVFWRVGA